MHSLNSTPTHYYNGEPVPQSVEFLSEEAATDRIIDEINAGVLLVSHRDHGVPEGWVEPSFKVDHLSRLRNGDALPVMFSVNCLTGILGGGEWFAESLLEISGGGVVGVVGARLPTPSWHNDELSKGMFDAIWPDFDHRFGDDNAMTTKLGPIMNHGKMYMYVRHPLRPQHNEPGGEQLSKEDIELFHVLGDPEMDLKVPHIVSFGSKLAKIKNSIVRPFTCKRDALFERPGICDVPRG